MNEIMIIAINTATIIATILAPDPPLFH